MSEAFKEFPVDSPDNDFDYDLMKWCEKWEPYFNECEISHKKLLLLTEKIGNVIIQDIVDWKGKAEKLDKILKINDKPSKMLITLTLENEELEERLRQAQESYDKIAGFMRVLHKKELDTDEKRHNWIIGISDSVLKLKKVLGGDSE